MPTSGIVAFRPRRRLGIMLVGGLSFLIGLILTVALLIRTKGLGSGFELLAIVSAFGVYASVQFLRGKSIKLLAIALTLGAAMNIIALIAMPIWDAQQPPENPSPAGGLEAFGRGRRDGHRASRSPSGST